MAKIYLSSTFADLVDHRKAVLSTLRKMGHEVVAMEDYGAADQRPLDKCLDDVAACQIYVGIFAHRYGYIPVDGNPQGQSITEREFRQAVDHNLIVLIFLVGKTAWLPDFMDAVTGEGEGGARIAALKKELGTDYTADFFTTPEDLAGRVAAAVGKVAAELTAPVSKPDTRESAPTWINLPARPAYLVGRETLMNTLIARLTHGENAALDGQGGVGKTTLAAALVYEPSIRAHFTGGILWASLGTHPDLDGLLRRWADGLKVDLASRYTLPDRAQALRDWFGDQRFLIVIDDAWSYDAAQALRCGGTQCSYLLTTRDKIIARRFVGAENTYNLPLLEPNAAYSMLETLAPEACQANPSLAQQLVQATDGLALAIELVGGYLAERSLDAELFPELSQAALQELVDPLKRLELAGERLGVLSGQKVSLGDSLSLSLADLPEAACKAFNDLGAFAPKPASFTRPAAEAVTQAGLDALAQLVRRNMLEVDEKTNLFRLDRTLSGLAASEVDPLARQRHFDFYLALVKANPYDWPTVADNFLQLQQAWHSQLDVQLKLGFLQAMTPYFRVRRAWRTYVDWTEDVLNLAADQLDMGVKGSLQASLGQAYYYLGDFEQSIAQYQAAIPSLEAAGDILGQARTLVNLGVVYQANGDDRASRDYFLRAMPLVENSQDSLLAFSWMTNLVFLHRQLSEFLEKIVFVIKFMTDRGTGLDASLVNATVDLLYPLKILQFFEHTPFLAILEMFASDESLVYTTDGRFVLGIKPEGEANTRYWQALIKDGRMVESAFSDTLPDQVTAGFITDERSADQILMGNTPVDAFSNPESFVGDMEKAAQFFVELGTKMTQMGQKDNVDLSTAALAHQVALFLGQEKEFTKAVEVFTQSIQAGYQVFERMQADLPADPDESAIVRLITTANELADSVYWRSIAYSQLGDFKLAEGDLTIAIQFLSPLIQKYDRRLTVKQAANILAFRATVRENLDNQPGALEDLNIAINVFDQLNKVEAQDSLQLSLAEGRFQRANLNTNLGNYPAAREDYQQAIEYYSSADGDVQQTANVANTFAWLLATSPDETVRDGSLAVQHATQANELSEWTNYQFFDTLAATYAEAGDFPQAVEWQQKALEGASEAEAGEYRSRLELYQQGKPFRSG